MQGLLQQQIGEVLESAQARIAQELADENDAIRRCVELEGEQSFYKWWCDDAQVPPFGSRKDRIEMIEQRILSLSKHEESVPNEEGNGAESG